MTEPAVTPARVADRRVAASSDGAEITVRSPYDGRVVGRVPRCGADLLGEAVGVASALHRGGAMPVHERAEVLERAARLLVERRDHLAEIISAESAKPIATARVEATRAVDTFTYAAIEARRLSGEVVPLEGTAVGAGKLGFTLRVPRGVVAAISPFNFPLNLVAHKVAPAIAAGCPVVLKPASSTPLTALALADLLLDECGLPAGWLQVVPCAGSMASHLVEHPDVAFVTFTGSPDVGWGIKAQVPRKKVVLELGNNAPVIVAPDGDRARAAKAISIAGFSFAGQSCISVQRVLVHRSIHDAFVAELVGHVEALVVGDPADPATQVSALITADETERVQATIDDAVAGGAEIRCGGKADGRVLLPTVLTGVRPEMEVCSLEVFGPVVGVQAYDDLDEALAIANDTRYGLQAGIYTSDLGTALRAARELDFGGVTVNEAPTWRADQMPYGGVRDSGNTREGPAYAVEEMTERRLVIIQA
jgi:acyl-CoA reductase-like NAD-dependent aldehyde dehydrogenase